MIIIKLVYPNSDGIWKHTDGGKWENEKLKKCNKRGKKTYQYKYSYKPLSQFHLCFCRMPSGTNQMIAKSWWNFLLSKFLLPQPSSSLWKQQDKSNHQQNIYVARIHIYVTPTKMNCLNVFYEWYSHHHHAESWSLPVSLCLINLNTMFLKYCEVFSQWYGSIAVFVHLENKENCDSWDI